MKILFLSDDFPPESYGGAGIVASSLAGKLSSKGHEVIVLTATQDITKVEDSLHGGIRIIRLYSKYDVRFRNYLGAFNPFIVFRAAKIMRDLKPDVIHAHNIHYYFSFSILRFAKKYSRAVFFTTHDSHAVSLNKVYPIKGRTDYKISIWREMKYAGLRFNPLRRILIRHFLRYADRIFSVSESLKLNLEANGIDNIEVVHNGVDASEWHEHAEAKPKTTYGTELGQDDLTDKKVVLFSGRLSGGKGAMSMIDAMGLVIKKIPNAYLLVLGKKGEYTDKMQKHIEGTGMVGRVGFTGWITGDLIRKAYQACDILAVPSLYLDPFPTVNLEAMAMGKPVVGTCFGGTPEAVKDGENGYIVDPFDSHRFSDRLIELLSDDRLRESMGQKGRVSVEKSFSLDFQVDKTVGLYHKYLKINGRE